MIQYSFTKIFFKQQSVVVTYTYKLHRCLKKKALGIFKKEAIFLLHLRYGYVRNNLARLSGYPTHRDVAYISNLFYFHFVFI